MSSSDKSILRDLAKRYAEICRKDVQRERRALWRRKNSLKPTQPLIYVRAFAWSEMAEAKCLCADPFFRKYENDFRQSIFRDTFNDDFLFEPWATVDAKLATPPNGLWGLPVKWIHSDDPRGAKQFDPSIKDPEDAKRMVAAHHEIDEKATSERVERLHDAIGDIITINVDRGPVYRTWASDISTYLAYMRGLEQIMWDMADRPEWLHGVLAFMRDGILRAHEEAEKAGDWTLCDHQNQSMPYAEELDDPAANSDSVTRDRLWNFCASQETGVVGPAMFEEFMFRYQFPICEKFGLVAYGCCEDLTRKIGVIRKLPNLRRIAVALTADVKKCAEQIGQDYVLSYRPSPADMVGYGFSPDRIREILRRDLSACRDCHVDITLKDVETVQSDPNRVRKWVEVTRQVIDEFWPG